MATLTISHHIFLNEEQRNALVKGENTSVIGSCIIVMTNNQGKTNEPARERFCRYELVNNPKYKSIKVTDEGFKINLPQLTEKEKLKMESVRKLSNEVWIKIDKKQREAIYEWISKDNGDNLLNKGDGGAEFLQFKYQTKGEINTIHYVCIEDIKRLCL